METICKECIFAQISDGEQTGCSFNRLEKYINQGRASKKSEWFYTIQGLCEACTKKNIGQILPDNFKEIVYNNIKPKVDAIIYGDDNTICSILDTIKNDNYNRIIACQPNIIDDKSYNKFNKIYNKIIVSCQVENSYDLEFLDNACYKSNADYITIINSCQIPNILKTVENLIMNEVISFIGILPEKELHGLIIKPKIFKYFNGNFDKLITEKIKSLNNYESMVLQWNSLK